MVDMAFSWLADLPHILHIPPRLSRASRRLLRGMYVDQLLKSGKNKKYKLILPVNIINLV